MTRLPSPRPAKIVPLLTLLLSPAFSRPRAEALPTPALSSPTAAVPLFDLDACLRAALANNPSLSLAEDELAAAVARRRAASAGLLPAVTLRAEETSGKADLTGQTPAFVERLYGVQLTQPLFHGGRRWSLQRQARLRAEMARLEREKRRNDLHHEVAQSYWRVASLEDVRRTYAETCPSLQEDLEKASRRELGPMRAARIELLSTRAQSRECEIRLEETEADLLQARNRLLDVMGQRNSIAFDVAPVPEARPVEADEEECARLALRHRAELAIAELSAETARWGRRAARGLAAPRVDANGFYGRSGAAFAESEPFRYQDDWNAGVKVSWAFLGNTAGYSAAREKTSPKLGDTSRTETESHAATFALGDSFQNAVETRESRAALSREQWRLDQTRRDVEQDARLACRRLSASWKRVEAAGARLEQALQEFRDVRHLLGEDRAHLGDAAAGRNRIAGAQASRAQALAEYHAAVFNLNRAVGIPGRFRAGETAP